MKFISSLSNVFHPFRSLPDLLHYNVNLILSKIERITDHQIHDMSTALADLIIVNLGDNASERYSKPAPDSIDEIDIHSISHWEQDYLPCSSHLDFPEILTKHISEIIRQAFSNPQSILENGLHVVLSEDEPVGPLLAVLNETNVLRFENDMPKNYEISLKLAEKPLSPSGNLHFELDQKINGVLFYSVTFEI